MRESVVRELVTRFMTEPDYLGVFQTEVGRARIINGYDLPQDELDPLSGAAPSEWGFGRLEARISASLIGGLMGAPGCACDCPNTGGYSKKPGGPPQATSQPWAWIRS